ncbi:unnamed protein product, partial [Effrenium voratum]
RQLLSAIDSGAVPEIPGLVDDRVDLNLGITGMRAPTGPPGARFSRSLSKDEGALSRRSRSGSGSPTQRDGVYVPPHERPMPKGQRYDPSQDQNYLQQLQQIQQSKETATARLGVQKFKRAVDMLRK